ncbi:MAG: peptidoglycan DD-metalloendopeptidase family protein [Bacillota bacterium]|nr:peptidoglycan DD-metalloendopeptidase family protein [Bacillota bacterium]
MPFAFAMKSYHFIAVAAIAVIFMLGIHVYLENYVYVVVLDDQEAGFVEVGVVRNAEEIESYIEEIIFRCGELYGMPIEVEDNISLIREFRPENEPDSEAAREFIRRHLNLAADAYMITVDGKPVAPVSSEKELDLIVDSLEASFTRTIGSGRVLEAFVVEELGLENCTAAPDSICSADEVVDLLVENSKDNTLSGVYLAARAEDRTVLNSRYAERESEAGEETSDETPSDETPSDETPSSENPSPELASFNNIPKIERMDAEMQEQKTIETDGVHVKVIEEVTVYEPIPFSVEYIYDDEMWVVQSEVTTPGEDGLKEIIYHVTLENGTEVNRTKLEEKIIKEPVPQVITQGMAKVPSIGEGQFIWPVASRGEVTPGRGFSSWHTGIDINAPMGTGVLAADNGVVWFSGYGGSQGNYIILYHGAFWTLYLHNSENLVQKGDQVNQGDVIALLGSTGRSTGPHLHFEVRVDDGTGEWHAYYQHEPIDPLQFFRP